MFPLLNNCLKQIKIIIFEGIHEHIKQLLNIKHQIKRSQSFRRYKYVLTYIYVFRGKIFFQINSPLDAKVTPLEDIDEIKAFEELLIYVCMIQV